MTNVFTDGRTDTMYDNNDLLFGRGLVGQQVYKTRKEVAFWINNSMIHLPMPGLIEIVINTKIYKKGVINDPFGQTHSLASSEYCFRLKFVLF